MISTTTIDMCSIKISHNIFLPKLFLFHNYFFIMGKWQTINYEPSTHNSVICINYFVSIFHYVLISYYFQFIRLLNASNCFMIMFSFNDFIHKLTFLFKDTSWYKYLTQSNRAFLECYYGLFGFLFDQLPQVNSI